MVALKESLLKRVVITGSNGLVGSEAALFFDRMGWEVHGIDNNMRRRFFGPDGDTTSVKNRILRDTSNYSLHEFDLRSKESLDSLYSRIKPDVTIHCAAQPSHDLARERILEDFEINALSTLHLLQSAHSHAPDSTFVFMSTNKVYGDAPNDLDLVELETRWDYADSSMREGLDETCRLDASTHSFFGVSKASADLMVQEFGHCFGMKTVCFRGGCLTGPDHAGAELHGFLAYLVRAASERRPYTVFGYKGKQVRDNLHTSDVCGAIWEFVKSPRPAAVYNLGGGRNNSISVLEAVRAVEERLVVKMNITISEEARLGDHICYISDTRRFRQDYPDWRINHSIDAILDELCGKAKVHS